MLSIPVSTLRYYDSQGVLPGIQRRSSGYREYTRRDLENLKLVRCFKLAGMSIKDIRQYFIWAEEGDETLEQRYQLILERQKAIDHQIELLHEQRKVVDKKAEWYRQQLEQSGTAQNDQEKTSSGDA